MGILSSPQNFKRFILTGAVTVITITGSLYGAGLKTEQENTQKVQRSQEITLDERIASLRGMRQNLVMKKELVEKQIRDLDTRIEERAQKGINNKRG